MIAAREQYRGLGDSTVEHRSADDAVVVTDSGVATEAATQDDETLITILNLELPERGGKKYVRCEGCRCELLTELGGRNSFSLTLTTVRT
ncbi:hypothetical protein HAPAU_39780 [Halalkalicoccus paucihalophilus]|uniref:DUF8118 domain-containing protein n=1 Tax=Halalkalicoccus paucihalophilus TaxID=1008153 RepID=A0A151A8F2_9EURY|nr:hypothetical protein [Halalkalicoccus paucihalophilus]KYH23899.1 hypothetical protein HAPAU_39780 [Halalkalicoccus paucihalophilus]